MTEDCDRLRKQLHEHEEKSRALFEEAESLHQKALQTPVSKRSDLLREAFAKQKEAISEINIMKEIKRKLRESGCEEANDDK